MVISYDSEFNRILLFAEACSLIVFILLLRKIMVEEYGIMHLIILFGLMFAILHGLWMLFGRYEIDIQKSRLTIRRVLVFPFYSKKIILRDIEKLEHIENYASIYGWGWGGLTFPLMFENALKVCMNNQSKVVVYLPDVKTYTKISDFMAKNGNGPD